MNAKWKNSLLVHPYHLVFLAIFIYGKYYFTIQRGWKDGNITEILLPGANIQKPGRGDDPQQRDHQPECALASEKFLFRLLTGDCRRASKAYRQYGTVHYKEKNGSWCGRGDTEYFVDKVTAKMKWPKERIIWSSGPGIIGAGHCKGAEIIVPFRRNIVMWKRTWCAYHSSGRNAGCCMRDF